MPEDADLGLRLTYIIYYYSELAAWRIRLLPVPSDDPLAATDPGCDTNLTELTPAGHTGDLTATGDPNPAAERTHLLSIIYLAVSLLWILASLIFLGEDVRTRGKCADAGQAVRQAVRKSVFRVQLGLPGLPIGHAGPRHDGEDARSARHHAAARHLAFILICLGQS